MRIMRSVSASAADAFVDAMAGSARIRSNVSKDRVRTSFTVSALGWCSTRAASCMNTPLPRTNGTGELTLWKNLPSPSERNGCAATKDFTSRHSSRYGAAYASRVSHSGLRPAFRSLPYADDLRNSSSMRSASSATAAETNLSPGVFLRRCCTPQTRPCLSSLRITKSFTSDRSIVPAWTRLRASASASQTPLTRRSRSPYAPSTIQSKSPLRGSSRSCRSRRLSALSMSVSPRPYPRPTRCMTFSRV